MAKSTGNIARVAELLDAGVSPRALRYALIAVHYRATSTTPTSRSRPPAPPSTASMRSSRRWRRTVRSAPDDPTLPAALETARRGLRGGARRRPEHLGGTGGVVRPRAGHQPADRGALALDRRRRRGCSPCCATWTPSWACSPTPRRTLGRPADPARGTGRRACCSGLGGVGPSPRRACWAGHRRRGHPRRPALASPRRGHRAWLTDPPEDHRKPSGGASRGGPSGGKGGRSGPGGPVGTAGPVAARWSRPSGSGPRTGGGPRPGYAPRPGYGPRPGPRPGYGPRPDQGPRDDAGTIVPGRDAPATCAAPVRGATTGIARRDDATARATDPGRRPAHDMTPVDTAPGRREPAATPAVATDRSARPSDRNGRAGSTTIDGGRPPGHRAGRPPDRRRGMTGRPASAESPDRGARMTVDRAERSAGPATRPARRAAPPVRPDTTTVRPSGRLRPEARRGGQRTRSPPPEVLAEGEELVAGRRPVEEAFVARRPAHPPAGRPAASGAPSRSSSCTRRTCASRSSSSRAGRSPPWPASMATRASRSWSSLDATPASMTSSPVPSSAASRRSSSCSTRSRTRTTSAHCCAAPRLPVSMASCSRPIARRR